jgi:hypothetical protein
MTTSVPRRRTAMLVIAGLLLLVGIGLIARDLSGPATATSTDTASPTAVTHDVAKYLQEQGYVKGDKVDLMIDDTLIKPTAWNLGDEFTVYVLGDMIVAVQKTAVMCEAPVGLDSEDTVNVAFEAFDHLDPDAMRQYHADAVEIPFFGVTYVLKCRER